jgi:acylphosphatase
MGKKVSVEIMIEGSVQGVGFRAFVLNTAARLGLDGYVMNMDDGNRVKVEAEGEETAVNSLAEALGKGSMFSRIDGISVIRGEFTGNFRGFTIKY